MPAKDYNVLERCALAILGRRIIADQHDVLRRLRILGQTFGVSVMSIRRWVARFDGEGIDGLERRGRSDFGVSRSTCLWATKRACSMAKSRKRQYSYTQIAKILQADAERLGPEFCSRCQYAGRCNQTGQGVKVGSRHSIGRIVHCAVVPKTRIP